MSENPVRLTVLNPNSAFPAFFFPLYGTALLEAGALRAGAGISVQAFIALLCLSFAAAEYLRYRRTLSLTATPKTSERQRPTKLLTIRDAGWYLLMLVIGNIFGELVMFGFAIPMLIFVIGLQFLPWSRACACHRDFYTSGVLIAIGAAYALLFPAGPIGTPVSMLIAGWVLWSGAVFAFIRRL